MTKRKDVPRNKKQTEVLLSPAESLELQMILDRLAVQNPEGESFDKYLESLRKMLNGRDMIIVSLLDRLSRTPSDVAFRTYLALENLVTDRQLTRVVKQTAYRFSQKGFQIPVEAPVPERVVLVQREARKAVAHRVVAPGALWFFTALLPGLDHGEQTMVAAFLDPVAFEPFVRVSDGTARSYRKFLDGFSDRRTGVLSCEISMEHAARLFSDILKYRKGKISTAEIHDAGRLLRPYLIEGGIGHLDAIMAGLGEPPAVEDVDVGRVVAPDDWPWILFSKEELTPYRQRLLEIENAVLVVSQSIKDDRMRDIVSSAVGDLCDPRKLDFLARFFEEQAAASMLCGNREHATMSWSVARHLRNLDGPSESSFLKDIVYVSMGAHWPDEPAGAEPEKRRDPYRETPSGIIIPG